MTFEEFQNELIRIMPDDEEVPLWKYDINITIACDGCMLIEVEDLDGNIQSIHSESEEFCQIENYEKEIANLLAFLENENKTGEGER